MKFALEAALADDACGESYPDPVERCGVCHWQKTCDERRRSDDHLSFVAGLSKLQADELRRHGIGTLEQLASMPLPLAWKPDRGAAASFERAREQARIQLEGRNAGRMLYELSEVDPNCGLSKLPEPSEGDVFLDLEGDPFIGEGGFEYLFGFAFRDQDEGQRHVAGWAFTPAQEKVAFERFIDFVTERKLQWPDLHIYHFAPYEPSALKRLMGRHASREDELDVLLRGQTFVDLYAVVRHGLIASVESYSIKRLERLYGFSRDIELGRANRALGRLQAFLELGGADLDDADREVVEAYNRDDCVSTWRLRDWLEERRSELLQAGAEIGRPTIPDGAPSESVYAWQSRTAPVVDRLIHGVPIDHAERSPEQHGRWLLAHMLDWHRRELKSVWWEYFRLRDLMSDDLVDERAAIGGLTFGVPVSATSRSVVHRYRFPPQETDLKEGDALKARGGAPFGSVVALSVEEGWVDVKKGAAIAEQHSDAVFAHTLVKTDVLQESLFRLGSHVAEHGLLDHGPYQAARALLVRARQRSDGQPLQRNHEGGVEAAVRIAGELQAGVLPIQGPPGTGKTYTGARMIIALVEAGRRVGITANSHKVIRNLIDAVLDAARESGIGVRCILKVTEKEQTDVPELTFDTDNGAVLAAIGATCQVAGGTAWFWSRPEAFQAIDVLFVDEAAQMALANVLAVSQAALTVVLLGDPQQLDQPTKGSHPDGTDVSALYYLLGSEKTVAADRGLFLRETWRLHPDVCRFTSELFYDGRLVPRSACGRQLIRSGSGVAGTGLRFLPVFHEGNQSSSSEEADVVARLIEGVLASSPTWTDREGIERGLLLSDILVITPYNAQVAELRSRLPEGARIGTTDKFQGQEAPLAIYSMATSSHADAPRGMEFLYSLNRLNVATSRAKCVSVLVASPALLEAECRTPRQMQLANAYCRFIEMSSSVKNGSVEAVFSHQPP